MAFDGIREKKLPFQGDRGWRLAAAYRFDLGVVHGFI